MKRMKFDTTPPIRSSEITDERIYMNRRQFLRSTGIAAGAALASACDAGPVTAAAGLETPSDNFGTAGVSGFSTDEEPNSYEDITTYNNFYEFGTGKSDPHRRAKNFESSSWAIEVSGECDKPGTYDIDELVAGASIEERIYRLRCVEAWSMVIPWEGFELNQILNRFEPNSRAKYVRFETLYDPKRMPGQRSRVLDWPYVEGLTMAEAMHPLTIMVVGVYGKTLPAQNGAPIRLMSPWKYGFKGIKSIVSIEFTEKQPLNSWQKAASNEYGFYANVNPEVDHPRWSQARERRIGGSLFAEKQPTLMFNGYGEYVAGLYEGLDLRRNF